VIIAKSFARIFYRNCVNNGILPIICPPAVEVIRKGDVVTVDVEQTTIVLERLPEQRFSFPPLSPSMQAIIEAGGLIPMLRRKLGTEHLPMPEVKFAAE